MRVILGGFLDPGGVTVKKLGLVRGPRGAGWKFEEEVAGGVIEEGLQKRGTGIRWGQVHPPWVSGREGL